MRRKEERSKQGQTNNKAKQHSTPKAVTFPKKNEQPRVGLEPTTLYNLDIHIHRDAVPYPLVVVECRERLVQFDVDLPEEEEHVDGAEVLQSRLELALRVSVHAQAVHVDTSLLKTAVYTHVRMCIVADSLIPRPHPQKEIEGLVTFKQFARPYNIM